MKDPFAADDDEAVVDEKLRVAKAEAEVRKPRIRKDSPNLVFDDRFAGFDFLGYTNWVDDVNPKDYPKIAPALKQLKHYGKWKTLQQMVNSMRQFEEWKRNGANNA